LQTCHLHVHLRERERERRVLRAAERERCERERRVALRAAERERERRVAFLWERERERERAMTFCFTWMRRSKNDSDDKNDIRMFLQLDEKQHHSKNNVWIHYSSIEFIFKSCLSIVDN
jgi:hypothetical protein